MGELWVGEVASFDLPGFELATAIPGRIASLTLLNTTIDVTEFKSPWTMQPFRHRGLGGLWMPTSR